jgi:hypothetical protein
MAVSKLQSVMQRQANDQQVVMAGQVRIDAMQSAKRLTPASLSLWRPATTLAGLEPFADIPDPVGKNPNGSRAGRSVSRSASHSARGRISTARFVPARSIAGECYRRSLAG